MQKALSSLIGIKEKIKNTNFIPPFALFCLAIYILTMTDAKPLSAIFIIMALALYIKIDAFRKTTIALLICSMFFALFVFYPTFATREEAEKIPFAYRSDDERILYYCLTQSIFIFFIFLLRKPFKKDDQSEEINNADWWKEKRKIYNLYLIIVGLIAGACTVIFNQEFELTLVTLALNGFSYLIYMGFANLCYHFGKALELVIKPTNVTAYRKIAFVLGLIISLTLPLAITISSLIKKI